MSNDLQSHAGYTIDDPFDPDITIGRTYNQIIFGNLVYDVTKLFTVGLELSTWRTLYAAQRGGSAHVPSRSRR